MKLDGGALPGTDRTTDLRGAFFAASSSFLAARNSALLANQSCKYVDYSCSQIQIQIICMCHSRYDGEYGMIW